MNLTGSWSETKLAQSLASSLPVLLLQQRARHSTLLLLVFALGGVVAPPVHWISHAVLAHAAPQQQALDDEEHVSPHVHVIDCDLCGLLAKASPALAEASSTLLVQLPPSTYVVVVRTVVNTPEATGFDTRAPPLFSA